MDRQLMLKVLVPVGGLALLLMIVGGVIALSNMETTAPTGSPPPHTDANITPKVASDVEVPGTPPREVPKFDFALDGPNWKDVNASVFPGLKYWDVTVGSGAVCPNLNERPRLIPVMHYTGWVTSGVMFQSSLTSGSPLAMSLAQLVRGWQEGVPGMKVGGKRRLLIPSQYGYGSRGQGAAIPPNADLVFELELLDIK